MPEDERVPERPRRNPRPRAAVDVAVAEVTVDTAAAELPAPDGVDDDDAVEEASQPEPPPAPPAIANIVSQDVKPRTRHPLEFERRGSRRRR